MPHFPKVWPRGIANAGSSVEASDLYRLDANLTQAIDGDGGGLWVPAMLAPDTSTWTFYKTRVTPQITLEVDADGGKNAIYVTDSTDNAAHYVTRNMPGFVSGATYVFSFFAKKKGVRYVWSSVDPGTSFVYWDLQAGAVGTTAGGATGAITSVGNGWYLCTATIPTVTGTRVYVGMSTANGTAVYAGAGTGVLLYKVLPDFDSGTTRARPVVVGGAGLQPTLTPAKNPLFGEAGGLRTVVREISALPAQIKSGGGLPTSGSYIQGLASASNVGQAADRLLFLCDVPDGATIVSVTAYLKVTGVLRVPLPNTLPGISVLRTTITTGAEQELRSGGRANFVVGGQGIPDNYIVPPAGPNVYPTTGGPDAVQQWTYTADQMNPVDRSTYFYTIRLYDESGGTATQGNTFLGYSLTYVTPDLRVA